MTTRMLAAALVVAVLGLISVASAQDVADVRPDVESLDLGPHVALLEESEGALTLDDVTSDSWAQRFRESGMATLNLGYTSSPWWFRFHLENRTPTALERYLEIGYPRLDDVTLYTPEGDGEYRVQKLGDRYPFAARELPHRNFVTAIRLPPGERRAYYLRIETEDSLQFPLTLLTERALGTRDRHAQLALGLYYGVAVAMVLYNLLLLFGVRDRNYLFYVAYVCSYSIFQFASNGLGYQYLWPESPWWASRSIHVFAASTILFAATFGRSFLRSHEHAPLLDRALAFLQVGGLVMVVANLFFYNAITIRLTVAGAALVSIVLLLTGAVSLRRGYRPARFFVAAWTLFLSGVITNALKQFGVLPAHFFTEYGMQLGASAEMVLLSFSLADRIKLLERDKDRAQQEALENLQKADRLKDEFIATTSHELRTPLHAMVATSDNLLEELDSDEARGDVSLIAASARRLANLVDEILDFAQLRSKNLELQLRAVPLVELTEVIVSLCRSLSAENAAELRNDVPKELPPVLADEDRLQQILYNLIGNAIKFTKHGVVAVNARVAGDRVEVSVEDTGIGIEPDELQKIFEPFEQAGARGQGYGGTGLGLSVTRQLVELHGGEIRASSELGKGTTVTFTLPVAHEQAEPLRKTKRIQALAKQQFSDDRELLPSAGEGHRILIVDDELVNLRVLSTQLSRERYNVTMADSGERALEMIESEGRPDLILLDIMMPGMSGYDVCRTIRKTYSANELPIIMVSARNRVSDLLSGLDSGANDYIEKPFQQAELLGRINTHVSLSKVHEAVSRFVPREFLSALNRDDILDMQVGEYVEREVSVLFLDVRGFTSFVERLSPQEAIRMLNEILGTVGPVARERGGFVAQFTGDGLEAIFPRGPEDALRAALDLHRAMRRLNEQRAERGEDPIRIGTGIHGGSVAIGIVGERNRMEGLVVSDVVNLAARVEGLTKWFGASIVFTEAILQGVESPAEFNQRYLGRVRVVGREQAIGIYELREGPQLRGGEAETRFQGAVTLYEDGRFAAAATVFRQVAAADPSDGVAARFAELCEEHEDSFREGAWQRVDFIDGK